MTDSQIQKRHKGATGGSAGSADSPPSSDLGMSSDSTSQSHQYRAREEAALEHDEPRNTVPASLWCRVRTALCRTAGTSKPTGRVEPELTEPEPAEPETAEQEPAEWDSNEPEAMQPDTAERVTAEPDNAEPETAEPDNAEPETAEPPRSARPGDESPCMSVGAVRKQAETVRRLAHRAVDLIVDCGCHKLLTASVVDSLAFINWDEDVKNIADFTQKSCAPPKEVSRS